MMQRLTPQCKSHLLRVSYGTETCGVSAGALKFHVRASAWPRDRAIISPAENIIVIHWESHLVRSPCAQPAWPRLPERHGMSSTKALGFVMCINLGDCFRKSAKACPSACGFHPYRRAEVTADRFVYFTKCVWLAIEDDCWSIEALRDVNSLAAAIALKKILVATVRFSLI